MPLTTFKLNSGGTAYVDGTNRSVALSGSVLFTTPIMASVRKSILGKNANVLNFATPVFFRGSERLPFSLETWFLPMYFTGTISLMSHNAAYDGLVFDGDNIIFRVYFENTGLVSTSYAVPDAAESMHVVGVYTQKKIQLYVNGAMVSEAEISDAQVKDGFKTRASNALYVGQSANASQVGTFDGITVYQKAITDQDIYLHYLAGRRTEDIATIVGVYGGLYFDGTERDVFIDNEWNSTNWTDSDNYTDVSFNTGNLTPIQDPNTLLSLPGQWVIPVEVGASDTNIYGVRVDWDGDGAFVVESSIDGGTVWNAVTNSRNIAGTWNWNPTDKIVLLRVTFTGGLTSDISNVRRIRAVVFSSPALRSSDLSRSATINGINVATSSIYDQPLERNFYSGIQTYGDSITITPDVEIEDARNVRSLEFWIKFNTTTSNKYVFDTRAGSTEYLWVNNTTFFFSFPSGTVYVDGVAISNNAFTPIADRWYHIVYVFTAGINVPITIPSVDKTISSIAAYPTALSASDVATMYSLYMGFPSAALATETNPVSEPATPYRLYAYNWSN